MALGLVQKVQCLLCSFSCAMRSSGHQALSYPHPWRRESWSYVHEPYRDREHLSCARCDFPGARVRSIESACIRHPLRSALNAEDKAHEDVPERHA